MSYIMVDIESDGQIPGDYSMIEIGAVVVEKGLKKRFYSKLKPISDKYNPESLSISGYSREETLGFEDASEVMKKFDSWINENSTDKPLFVSDNNGFDWMFIAWYFHHFLGYNPFGYSSMNLGSFYKGIVRNTKENFKHLRMSVHTHNPLDDALGNAEAMLSILSIYDINECSFEASLFEKALNFAKLKHSSQKRKFTGEPYIVHPIRVAEITKRYGGTESQIIAAILHDTIEDTETTEDEIRREFGDEIAGLVVSLTNDEDEKNRLGKAEYLTKKISGMSSNSLLVKFADRLDNVNDLSSNNPDWSKTYARQTDYILSHLDNPNLNETHLEIIKKIKEIIRLFL